MNPQYHRSPTVLTLLAVVLLSFTPALSQTKKRVVKWSDVPISDSNTISTDRLILARIDALEIQDFVVSDKSITLAESFDADDEWLNKLKVRVKNVSNQSVSSVQMNLFLPEIMPGGPMVTLCYGCGDVGKGRKIMPGEEVEMRIVFYGWVVGQIKSKSSLSEITKAEIHDIILTPEGGRQGLSGCMKTASARNGCPSAAP